MRITAELSLYPLRGDALGAILAFIDELRHDARLEVAVNQMSTQIRGELRDVMGALTRALERSFAAGEPQALVAKILSSDLPIHAPPDLERRARP
ncbi:MAG TPA: YkoF family thiamine/hydroxymethylpyrimidine-binding protein [Gammaproteobacteria bacterium]